MKLKNYKNNVLFQQLGLKWFAFTEIDNEIFYTPLPEGVNPKTTKLEFFDVIENHLKNLSYAKKTKKRPEALG